MRFLLVSILIPIWFFPNWARLLINFSFSVPVECFRLYLLTLVSPIWGFRFVLLILWDFLVIFSIIIWVYCFHLLSCFFVVAVLAVRLTFLLLAIPFIFGLVPAGFPGEVCWVLFIWVFFGCSIWFVRCFIFFIWRRCSSWSSVLPGVICTKSFCTWDLIGVKFIFVGAVWV